VPWVVDIDLDTGTKWSLNNAGDDAGPVATGNDVAVGHVIEFAVPLKLIGAGPGDEVKLVLGVSREGIEIERHPGRSSISVKVPDESFEGRHWMV
jgi:hypothetical protein